MNRRPERQQTSAAINASAVAGPGVIGGGPVFAPFCGHYLGCSYAALCSLRFPPADGNTLAPPAGETTDYTDSTDGRRAVTSPLLSAFIRVIRGAPSQGSPQSGSNQARRLTGVPAFGFGPRMGADGRGWETCGNLCGDLLLSIRVHPSFAVPRRARFAEPRPMNFHPHQMP
jgi:hypothetical protein